VVFRGSFVPTFFQPRWFSKVGLLAEGVVEAAQIGVIHPQITDFSTSELQLQVTQDSFTINSIGKAVPDLALDLAIGTFTLLPQTPLSMVGVNHFVHFEIDQVDAWHEVGHRFVPKKFWQQFFDQPGMQSLTIRNTREGLKRDDGYLGYFDIKVEPSAHAKPFGLFVYVNDHVQIADPTKPTDAEEILKALRDIWPEAVGRAGDIFSAVQALIIEVSHGGS
jgi:hypothetical protein